MARSQKPEAKENGAYRVESLAKGLRILDAFAGARTTLTLSDLCERTGIPMATAFRLVATLTESEYLERLPSGAYRPGLHVLTLAHATLESSDIVQVSEGSLRALADLTGQTVNLAVLTGDRVLYLVRLRNSDLVTANIHVGSTLPAAHSSLGKVLLAELPAPELRRRLGKHGLEHEGGPNAISSMRRLTSELNHIRGEGFGIQDQEVAQGLRSIAAPVRNVENVVVAAINIALKASDFSVQDIQEQFQEPLLRTAADISRRLGAR